VVGTCGSRTLENKKTFIQSRYYFTGSTVSAETAAALAAASIVFKDTDPQYSNLCLKHAKELFNFADKTRSDAGYTAATNFYTSHSGFYDELTWAATWIYLATGDTSYLDKAESYVEFWSTEPQTDIMSYKWDTVGMTCATEHSFFWQGLQQADIQGKHGKTFGLLDSRS